ncbi:MAG TPA: HAD-IB family phosphatase [Polyangiales bacterium]|nr:HAD-IB family phosphatase [Polyangiales bacterium]
MANARTAAFFRAEGTLVDRGALAASAYFASNAQGFAERAFRIGALAFGTPVYRFLSQNDRTLATRAAYVTLRHMSEDRIGELADEYYADMLEERIYDRGRELIKRVRKEGHRVVLLSENIEPIAQRLASELGADDVVCNRLEFEDGKATGKLLEPIVGGHDTGKWLKRYAREHELDLERSLAYAAHGADLLLLTAVGRPCAVNPDLALRGAARDADWPVLEYR